MPVIELVDERVEEMHSSPILVVHRANTLAVQCHFYIEKCVKMFKIFGNSAIEYAINNDIDLK